ncbi:hypothetical protein [Asticcacaulis sp. EMRT-3]|uniref:hypothetical protein n=1 Tax=Asticcacaulis sp. EMRT-3 TaxID=3040349 RepID=UPI0024AE8A36|nr:hypothetical protein [Asticcacaulis sp. EMRT-3]MDI7774552.1 hypothetical protein [Asticcacaulis sp. EMRT-3]
MKRCVATVLALSLSQLWIAAPASAKIRDYTYNTSTLHDVVIADYGKRPEPSGILRTWLRIGVVENRLANLDVYINYLGESQKLPPMGATCDIVYHMGWIEGYYRPLKSVADQDRVVDHFNCKAPRKTDRKVRIS